jgi:ADP-ribose pyrophosphatase YjhB (NUDIX family)
LLIQRENNPYKNKWAFPGGKLESGITRIWIKGESIAEAMEREVYEETGYKFQISSKNELWNVNQI